ncbi:MAG: hypothetical protein HOH41_02395 [Porticoccaceae bacterium]|nr:hypothetical protein [Porticoccaceae bacterium]
MPIKSVAIVDRTRLKSTGILILCNQIRLVAVVWVTNKNVAITKDIKNAGICLIIMLFSLFTYSPTHSPTHLPTRQDLDRVDSLDFIESLEEKNKGLAANINCQKMSS